MSVRTLVAAAVLLAACSGTDSATGSVDTTTSTALISTAPVRSTVQGSSPTTGTTQAAVSTSSTLEDGAEPYVPPAPSHSDGDAVELAAALGVDRLLVADGTDRIAVADGIATRRPDIRAWSDGRFLYWNESFYDEATGVYSFLKSIASTFDWAVVCEFDQWRIHHVTERPDGSLVAGAERPWDWEGEEPEYVEGGLVEVPAFAVECSDGSSQPISSFRGYGGDSESFAVERVAGRVFTFHGDAEGNADYFNEGGVRLNGDDIVGSMLFNRAGSDAVYQIYVGGWAAAPALSVRKVDTTTADVLWTREFETPISSLDYDGNRVFVGLVPDGEEWLGYDYSTDRIVVLNGSDGEIIDQVQTSLSVHYAG